jgi:threonine dehydrogenase-like Zn-dependent dehydrogenase
MKAAVWYGGKDIRIEDVAIPTVDPEEVLIKVKAVGICGSELHAYEGLSKRRTPPLVMGHEFAGIIEQVGERSTGLGLRDRVVVDPAVPCGVCELCLSGQTNICRARRHVGIDFPGAFAQYVKVPSRACHKISDSISFEEAALAEPLSVGTHAASSTNVRDGDVVLILGSGVIGLSCLIAARERAGTILVSDLIDLRLNFAKLFGADVVIDASAVDPVSEVQRATSGKGADTVIEAVGLEKTVGQAISSVKDGGRVILVGMLDQTARVNILDITLKEIQIKGSYGRTSEDFRKGLTLLEKDPSTIRRLITHTFPLDSVSQAFETMSRKKESTMKIVLVP